MALGITPSDPVPRLPGVKYLGNSLNVLLIGLEWPQESNGFHIESAKAESKMFWVSCAARILLNSSHCHEIYLWKKRVAAAQRYVCFHASLRELTSPQLPCEFLVRVSACRTGEADQASDLQCTEDACNFPGDHSEITAIQLAYPHAISADSEVLARKHFGEGFIEYGFFPDTPLVWDWLVDLGSAPGNFCWTDTRYLLGSNGKLKSTEECSQGGVEFLRKLLCMGTFPTPCNSCFSLCPLPKLRYCFDFKQFSTIDFLANSKLRKLLKQFQISVNHTFKRSLLDTATLQVSRHGSTWIYPGLVDLLTWFVHHETASHVNSQQWSQSLAAPHADSCTSVGSTTAESTSSTPGVPEELPPIGMYVFELWDAKSGYLVAAVFTYIIGTVASDFTCGTFERGSRSCGTLLTRVVGHILQSIGITLWNWGLELNYMTEFGNRLGAVRLSAEQFYSRWTQEALGCRSCGKPYIPSCVVGPEDAFRRIYLSDLDRNSFQATGSLGYTQGRGTQSPDDAGDSPKRKVCQNSVCTSMSFGSKSPEDQQLDRDATTKREVLAPVVPISSFLCGPCSRSSELVERALCKATRADVLRYVRSADCPVVARGYNSDHKKKAEGMK